MENLVKRKFRLAFFETFLIVVFWMLLFASPFFLGNYENGFNWAQISRVWISLVPYLFIFLINRFVLLPYLFLRNHRLVFVITATLIITLMTFGMFVFRGRFFPRPDFSRQEVMVNEFGDTIAQKPFDRPAELSPNERPRPPRPNEQTGPVRFPDSPRRFHEPSEGTKPPPGRPGMEGPFKPPFELPPFISFFLISVLIVGFDTGLNVSVKWVRSEQKQSFIENENMQMQLAYLRNQVSPHFFMNTLNNIHALIDIDTDEAKESIIHLSKLMRHLLYDCEAETIPIIKEIEFIRNYVELMRLRYPDKIMINLTTPSQLPDKLIPPLLFTSFVENAFKHGISYKRSMCITISFLYADGQLQFQVRNNHSGSKSEIGYSGIGIANSKKRLDLLYGDRYKLNIEDKKDEFIVNLTIPV